jgi:beta-galactosidase
LGGTTPKPVCMRRVGIWWLSLVVVKDRNLKVRSKDPAFINAYQNYMMEVGKQLAPLQVNHGGNILMVQIENEYGSFSNDKEYLAQNEKIFREAGFDGLLFTCDGPHKCLRVICRAFCLQ